MQNNWPVGFYLNYRKALREIKQKHGINRIDFEILAIMDQKEMTRVYCKPSDVIIQMPSTKRKLVYDSFKLLLDTKYLTLIKPHHGRTASRYAINGKGKVVLNVFSRLIVRKIDQKDLKIYQKL